MAKWRVLLVDDHELVREGLKITFQYKADDIEVVGEAADGAAAVRLAEELRPDLVLMDIVMDGFDGVEATREIVCRLPGTKVLMLSTYEDEELLRNAMKAGAAGYLLKDIPGAELVQCIHRIMQGSMVLDGQMASGFMQHIRGGSVQKQQSKTQSARKEEGGVEEPLRLSEREREILRLLVEGRDNQEIADQLYLSGGTVRNYVSQIYERLGVHDRGQAVRLALLNHLVD